MNQSEFYCMDQSGQNDFLVASSGFIKLNTHLYSFIDDFHGNIIKEITPKRIKNKINRRKKGWKMAEKMLQPAFGYAQHPKADQNSQHLPSFLLYFFLSFFLSLFPSLNINKLCTSFLLFTKVQQYLKNLHVLFVSIET